MHILRQTELDGMPCPDTLIHGDCLEAMKHIADNSVDAVITDPPYGTKVTNWDHSIDERVFAECLRVSRGYCLFFYSNTRLWHILGILHGLGVDTWTIPWHKPNAMGFERKFAPQWVPIVCAYNGKLPYWGQDLIKCAIVPQDTKHPTPKPVPVIQTLIERSTKRGDIVFDPFGGSMTTAIAALNTGRHFITVELDSDYFEAGCNRVRTREIELASTLGL